MSSISGNTHQKLEVHYNGLLPLLKSSKMGVHFSDPAFLYRKSIFLLINFFLLFTLGLFQIEFMVLFFSLLIYLVWDYYCFQLMTRSLQFQFDHQTQLVFGQEFKIKCLIKNSSRLSFGPISLFLDFSGSSKACAIIFHNILMKGRSEIKNELTFKIDRNVGTSDLGPIKIVYSHFFGLYHFFVTFDLGQQVQIRPLIRPMPVMINKAGQLNISYGVLESETSGRTGNFYGVREYRESDPPNHIHWKSSSRHNKLMVKEFEILSNAWVAVFFDNFSAHHYESSTHSSFEILKRLTYLVGHGQLEHKNLLEIFANDLPLLKTENNSLQKLDKLIDKVQMTEKNQLVEILSTQLPSLKTCIIYLTTEIMDNDQKRNIEYLLQMGHSGHEVVVGIIKNLESVFGSINAHVLKRQNPQFHNFFQGPIRYYYFDIKDMKDEIKFQS